MSPLFGRKEQQPEQQRVNGNELQAEIDRLESLPLAELATEVMSKGFGPGGPGANEDDAITIGGPNIGAGPTISSIALAFTSEGNTRGADDSVRQHLYRLVAEGLQMLEHAGLIRTQVHTSMNSFDYTLTRAGRAALSAGTVQQILARGGA
jgi:hypothetical protein